MHTLATKLACSRKAERTCSCRSDSNMHNAVFRSDCVPRVINEDMVAQCGNHFKNYMSFEGLNSGMQNHSLQTKKSSNKQNKNKRTPWPIEAACSDDELLSEECNGTRNSCCQHEQSKRMYRKSECSNSSKPKPVLAYNTDKFAQKHNGATLNRWMSLNRNRNYPKKKLSSQCECANKKCSTLRDLKFRMSDLEEKLAHLTCDYKKENAPLKQCQRNYASAAEICNRCCQSKLDLGILPYPPPACLIDSCGSELSSDAKYVSCDDLLGKTALLSNISQSCCNERCGHIGRACGGNKCSTKDSACNGSTKSNDIYDKLIQICCKLLKETQQRNTQEELKAKLCKQLNSLTCLMKANVTNMTHSQQADCLNGSMEKSCEQDQLRECGGMPRYCSLDSVYAEMSKCKMPNSHDCNKCDVKPNGLFEKMCNHVLTIRNSVTDISLTTPCIIGVPQPCSNAKDKFSIKTVQPECSETECFCGDEVTIIDLPSIGCTKNSSLSATGAKPMLRNAITDQAVCKPPPRLILSKPCKAQDNGCFRSATRQQNAVSTLKTPNQSAATNKSSALKPTCARTGPCAQVLLDEQRKPDKINKETSKKTLNVPNNKYISQSEPAAVNQQTAQIECNQLNSNKECDDGDYLYKIYQDCDNAPNGSQMNEMNNVDQCQPNMCYFRCPTFPMHGNCNMMSPHCYTGCYGNATYSCRPNAGHDQQYVADASNEVDKYMEAVWKDSLADCNSDNFYYG